MPISQGYFPGATIPDKIAWTKILANPSQMTFLKSLHFPEATPIKIPSKHTPNYARIHNILLHLCCIFCSISWVFSAIPISQVFNFSGKFKDSVFVIPFTDF